MTYELYVRSHLDYGDFIYHIPHSICKYSHSIVLTNQMEKLESVHYSTAFAVTGAWRGTSREKLYNELCWVSLNQFHALMNPTMIFAGML